MSMDNEKRIPLELLFGNPKRQSAQISPDGKHLAWTEPVEGVMNVMVGPVENPLEEGGPVSKDTERGVRSWFWAEDSRHILYVQDKGGDENWRIYGVDIDSGETRDYTPYDNISAMILKSSRSRPESVLIAMNHRNEELYDVYLLDLLSGELTLRTENPGNVVSWSVTDDLQVLGATTSTEEGGYTWLYRPTEEEEWREVLAWNMEDSIPSGVQGLSKDGKRVYYLDSREGDAGRAMVMNLEDGSTEVLYEDGRYDVSLIVQDGETGEPILAATLRDRLRWTALDPEYEKDLAILADLAGDDAEFSITGMTNDKTVWSIVLDYSDRSAQYYLYDRTAGTTEHLFASRPELDLHDLAPMESFTFTARDGRVIEGYLTFPTGSDRKGLPMVLNVHGGPWTRDTWGYHPEAQWLANRGTICMQVNYRGSTGYGKDHVNAGNREWGGKMHDDLIDGVKWAVDQGYADPERIAIYGGSYGGYSALVGATFTPEVFRCSVALVGPSNLITFIESIPPYWRPLRGLMKARIGDVETEKDFLMSRSPIDRVDDIAIPMLVAHGANDPRVKQAESEQIVAAMVAKGIDHEYMLFEDEGHGFAKPENKLKFYRAADRFLERNMG